MSRTLICTICQLTPPQRARIAGAAEARGFEARFFDDERDALPQMGEAEILFGDSTLLAGRAPKLRWLCTPSAGVNQYMALGVFASPDAMVSNSSGAYGVTIAEHTVMVTLELMRRQAEYNAIVARRAWERALPVRSILGCRALLIGTGDIGREVALRLRAFRPAAIIGVNRRGRNPGDMFDEMVTLDGLDARLPEADLVVMSLPATPQTRGLLSAQRLALLPEGAILVNVGRGSTVDQAALEARLRAGTLSAALDVFEEEPIPAESSLWNCPNLLITPHVAGNMTLPYTLERIVALFLEDFDRYCAGEPLARRVDLTRGY